MRRTLVGTGALLSRKELFYRAHRHQKLSVDSGKFNRTIFLVECPARFVFRVPNDARRCNVFAQFEASIQRVH